MNKKNGKHLALVAAGLVFSIIPVAVSILLYFPVWNDRGAAAVLSGTSLLLLLLAAVPLFKLIRKSFSTPSAYVMWLIGYVIFFMLSEIAKDMTVICLVGFISNIVGAVFFKLADRQITNGETKNEGQI